MIKGRSLDPSRRDLGKLVLGSIVAVPFGVAQALAATDRREIENVKPFDVLTADRLNEIINRVNELGREPRSRG